MSYMDIEEKMDEIIADKVDEVAERVTEEIIKEIRILRKEIANAWAHRAQVDHIDAIKKAKEEFMMMDIGSREGKNSFQKLREFYEKNARNK